MTTLSLTMQNCHKILYSMFFSVDIKILPFACLKEHVLVCHANSGRLGYTRHKYILQRLIEIFSNKIFCRRMQQMGYRQLARWCWEWLGKRVRVSLPACAVHKIQMTFPEEKGPDQWFHLVNSRQLKQSIFCQKMIACIGYWEMVGHSRHVDAAHGACVCPC